MLNLLSLRSVEGSADSVAGKVFDEPFAAFGSSRGRQGGGNDSDLLAEEGAAGGDCKGEGQRGKGCLLPVPTS